MKTTGHVKKVVYSKPMQPEEVQETLQEKLLKS